MPTTESVQMQEPLFSLPHDKESILQAGMRDIDPPSYLITSVFVCSHFRIYY